MNKNFPRLLFLILALKMTGCLVIPGNYTPSSSLSEKICGKKYDVTFSVDYLSDGDISIGRASDSEMIEFIREKLQETNAFASVSYRPYSEKSNYHIHFIVHYSMASVAESAAHGFFIGYTLLTIPTWQNMPIDISAILYVNKLKVYSTATTENLRCYIWLPFLPVCLLWNNWFAWTLQEKNCLNFIVNNLTDFQDRATENPELLCGKVRPKKANLSPPPPVPIEEEELYSGTGFAVSPKNIITALHLVIDRDEISVCFDGKTWLPAKLVKQSDALDIAVLEISSSVTYYLSLSTEEKPTAGDKVFTFGYPVVQLLGNEIKYAEGAISAMSGLRGDNSLIQTTVPIQPGNSGSPLFNEKGEVVGMLVSTAGLQAFLRRTGTIPQNINWAVKADYISVVLDQGHAQRKVNFKTRKEMINWVRQATCQIQTTKKEIK